MNRRSFRTLYLFFFVHPLHSHARQSGVIDTSFSSFDFFAEAVQLFNPSTKERGERDPLRHKASTHTVRVNERSNQTFYRKPNMHTRLRQFIDTCFRARDGREGGEGTGCWGEKKKKHKKKTELDI